MSAELIKYAKAKEDILTKEITKRTVNKAIVGLAAAIVITGITILLKYLGFY